MRRLKEQGLLDEQTSTFFKETKPEFELYDWEHDLHEMKNLADDPEMKEVLQMMKDRMDEYQDHHRDCGLEDRDTRVPDAPKGVQVREWLQKKQPGTWDEVTQSLFVKFQELIDRVNDR